MTDTPDEPNWGLLPNDPVRFFGLSDGFDRRDLKRRYNEFIRRFKPERHPEEFQRIRAAYEQLDTGIRYGLQARWTEPAEEYTWSGDAQSQPTSQSTPASGRSTTESKTAAPRPLHERLQRENASDIYREIESKKTKTPFDYYSLAVISDIVDRKDGQQFPRWLLQGLLAYPGEIGLLRLLGAYLRGPIDEKAWQPLLVACSKIIHENTYFMVTEPLWRTLLKSHDFPRFRDTLKQCETNLKGVSIDGRIAFYLQILKAAMWKADEAWIDESLNFIEHNFERILPFLDFEVEMVTRLRAYIKHRSTFAAGHPLFQRMDQALRDYFNEEQQIGDRSVLECQVQIVNDSDGLGDAFANLVDPAYGPFYAVWAWISHDVAERNIEGSPPPSDDNLWFPRTRTLLEQMARQTDNSRLGVGWVLATVSYRCTQLLCYVAPIVGLNLIAMAILPKHFGTNDNFEALAVLISIVAGAFAGHWLKNQLKLRAWFPFCRWMSARCYRRLWRPEIIGFLSRSHVPYRMLVAYIGHTSNSAIARWDWVRYFVELDFALPVYSVAQRFVV